MCAEEGRNGNRDRVLSPSDVICVLPQQLSDIDLAGPLQKEIQKLQEMRAQRRSAAASE